MGGCLRRTRFSFDSPRLASGSNLLFDTEIISYKADIASPERFATICAHPRYRGVDYSMVWCRRLTDPPLCSRIAESNQENASPRIRKRARMKQSYYTSPAAQRTPAYEGSPVLDVNLILEGGAMRGQFTAGVLDYFMDNGLWCKNVVGTSAGALNGYNYVAGELGRTCYLNTKYCGDPRYLSMRNFALTGSAIRRDFMFDEIPNRLEPFNFDAFRNSPMQLTTVASNLETGEADYHVMKDAHDDRDLLYLQASASMPLVSKIIEVDGKKLLDGGPCDSVPLLHCILNGVGDKHIVVLTQDATYIKSPNKTMPLVHRVYSDYPLFAERMEHRHFEYNRTYRWVRKLHNEGKVFTIQPPEPVTISNMEKDPEKLLALYEQGYAEAARQWSALQAYLEQ